VLLEHIIYIANLTTPRIPFPTLDLLVRHLHAMTKIYPEFVATAFRHQFKQINESRMNEDLRAGDLILLTSVATIFPTSDHFHPVVTPSMLVMGRWLGQVALDSVRLIAIGSYVVTLTAQVYTLPPQPCSKQQINHRKCAISIKNSRNDMYQRPLVSYLERYHFLLLQLNPNYQARFPTMNPTSSG